MRNHEAGSRDLRALANRILKAALRAVEAPRLVRGSIRRQEAELLIQGWTFDLDEYENIYLAAFGKAAPYMAAALQKILGKRLTAGIATYLPGRKMAVANITCLPAAHPLPDERSVRAAEEILSLARRAGRRDLLFVMISGGGSAQVCLPRKPLSLRDKAWVTDQLLRAGADITELNIIRKHLSAIKGGRLAETAYPASVVNLVISDVVGNDLTSIASGPTHWDSSTFEDARRVLDKYCLWARAPLPVRSVILAGISGRIPETLRRGSRVFRKVSTFIIGDNRTALKAAAEKARSLGFHPIILTSGDTGEARDAARKYVALITESIRSSKILRKPLCFLAGGELTVTVRGKGKGGRNSEFVLAALVEMMRRRPRWEPVKLVTHTNFTEIGVCHQFRAEPNASRGWDWLVASVGTDGRDGPTEAAGAMATAATINRAQALGLNPEAFLDRNDSYNFFRRAGRLIITGPTETNVMDVRLILLRHGGKPHFR
ncbi:MAG: DUF4147 domain-containing protein [Acidobacteriota bacterium]